MSPSSRLEGSFFVVVVVANSAPVNVQERRRCGNKVSTLKCDICGSESIKGSLLIYLLASGVTNFLVGGRGHKVFEK